MLLDQVTRLSHNVHTVRLMHDFRSEFQAGAIDGGRFRVRLAVPL